MNHIYLNNCFEENWFDYEVFYKSMVDRFSDGSKFVEVGSWKGRSASFMMVEIINSNKNIEFTCIDTWYTDELYNKFLTNTSIFQNRLNHIRTSSADGSKHFKDKSLDFVFLDADHRYEAVMEDISNWLPKIKPNGVLAGHDYHQFQHEGVYNAINERFSKNEITITDKGCWSYNVKT